MAAIWTFLSDPGNREVLGWIGGGLWTFTFFGQQPDGSTPAGGTRTSYGLSGWPLVALVAALAGAIVLVAALSGTRVTATNGSVGGKNSGTITVQ